MNETHTFQVVKPFTCYVTDGNFKPSNSYYGNSQILRSNYEQLEIQAGTLVHSMAGGTWLELDGKLAEFSLDTRSPNDVGAFEKHHDPTRYVWEKMKQDGTVKRLGDVDMVAFMPKYRTYQKLA